MSNTSVKSLLGLLVLSVLVLILFLFGRKKKLSPEELSKRPLPERSNNPFAIVQPNTPSNWVGLTGSNDNGFLTFDTPINGVRAGFVNLYNRYIKQGLNTIQKIAPVYVGLNTDPQSYINGLVQFTGFAKDQPLNDLNLLQLGRAIERMENGSVWVSDSDYHTGHQLAMNYLK